MAKISRCILCQQPVLLQIIALLMLQDSAGDSPSIHMTLLAGYIPVAYQYGVKIYLNKIENTQL